MATLPNAFAEQDAHFGLEDHRAFIDRTSKILAGQEAQSVLNYGDYLVVNVYRVPSIDEIVRQPELAATNYGHIQYDGEGNLSIVLTGGETAHLNQVAANPQQALQYISQLMQQTTSRKIDLKLKSNKLLQKKRRPTAIPEAVQNIVSIYDALIKQIEHEHYHQLRLAKERQTTGYN